MPTLLVLENSACEMTIYDKRLRIRIVIDARELIDKAKS